MPYAERFEKGRKMLDRDRPGEKQVKLRTWYVFSTELLYLKESASSSHRVVYVWKLLTWGSTGIMAEEPQR